MSAANTARIRKQKKAPIFVVIGNPPYNMGQVNENDQNKNRKYKHMDARVQETYTRASTATLRNKLSDPYVKAFRWASDRIRAGGVVAFVSNDSFVDQIAFDGMRKYLAHDFDRIYVLDLSGNVRKNPKLSGTTHNVFGIQVGVAITLLIKKAQHDIAKPGEIFYATAGEDWKKEQKYSQLNDWEDLHGAQWKKITPDAKNTWLTAGQRHEFEGFLPIGIKSEKDTEDCECLFRLFSLGVVTSRDAWVYNHSPDSILSNVKRIVSTFHRERQRFLTLTPKEKKKYAPTIGEHDIKWTDRLIEAVKSGDELKVEPWKIRRSLYRPYNSEYLYFDHLLNQRRYQQHRIFPNESCEAENISIIVKNSGEWPFFVLAVNSLSDLLPQGGSQCFPYYTYDEAGTNRHRNITDWALTEFRSHYGQKSNTKRDIFHYTYALLHHPEYRTRYAANLKRELPRIPLAPDFDEYARIGSDLMKLHLEYEQQREYQLKRRETGKLDWRVEKMSLSKDKTQLKYNDFLTMNGIPPEVYEYRLGNRSALEWVIDQYRVTTDKRSGIVNDPNRDDDPEYIVRLIGQVVTVSLETVKLVRDLSALPLLPS
ncbi:MAG: type ISP restriction/modification enzyme [Terracidiphilus sp.]